MTLHTNPPIRHTKISHFTVLFWDRENTLQMEYHFKRSYLSNTLFFVAVLHWADYDHPRHKLDKSFTSLFFINWVGNLSLNAHFSILAPRQQMSITLLRWPCNGVETGLTTTHINGQFTVVSSSSNVWTRETSKLPFVRHASLNKMIIAVSQEGWLLVHCIIPEHNRHKTNSAFKSLCSIFLLQQALATVTQTAEVIGRLI